MAQLITSIVVLLVVFHIFLLGTAYLILLERKISSWAQDRVGPMRVGPHGLLQPIADGLKFLMKEDYNPGNVDRALFLLAPVFAAIPALLGWAVVPWGGEWLSPWGTLDVVVADLNVGVIYMLAVGSLAVYGVVVGGWASNNKYAFFGGLRATAQMLSYEIPMGICVLCVLLLAGAASADEIVNQQAGYWWVVIPQWFIVQQPIAAILFFVCILAESNRLPFDLAEAEQELIGGYHTEYSSMKFALFFLGEYLHMITASAFLVLLFLGGWHLPWLDYLIYWGSPQPVETGIGGVILKMVVFMAKVLGVLMLMMWVRWTLPRFRFDQLMRLAWQSLIPLTILLLVITSVFVFFGIDEYMWAGNILALLIAVIVSPFIPAGPDVNRKVRLAGSRFNPVVE